MRPPSSLRFLSSSLRVKALLEVFGGGGSKFSIFSQNPVFYGRSELLLNHPSPFWLLGSSFSLISTAAFTAATTPDVSPANSTYPSVPSPNTRRSYCSGPEVAESLALSGVVSQGEGRYVSTQLSNVVYDTIMANSGAHQDMEASLDQLQLPLTTELVDEVIKKLRYEEKLAFRFFTWAGHHEDYRHEHQVFNDMIDILSSTKYKSKQFGIVCDVLDHMKRKTNYSISVEALLTILRSYTEKHLTHLSKFVNKKRIRVKSQSEINAFNLFLDSLCKCGLVGEAEAMFHKVKKKLMPDAHTYNVLFFGWCRVRNPKKAMNVLEEMILLGLTPEDFTYNAAIDAFCNVGMIEDARELFEFMRTKGSAISSPTAKTYSYMIVALAKADQIDECFKLLADMRNVGCLPDVSTFKELIEGMCSVGKVEEAYKILDEMGKIGYPPDILTYNCFLKVLCNLKKDDEAIKLCKRMIDLGCEPSVHTYNMLITMFFEMKKTDRSFGIWEEMEKRGCLRDVDTYCVMIEGLFLCERTDDARVLLEEVMHRGIKLPYLKFETLLSKLSDIGDLHTIHHLSEHMGRFYNRAMSRRYAITQRKKSISLRRRRRG